MGGSEYDCWLKGAKVLSTFSPMTNKMLSTPTLNTAMAGKHLSVFRLSLMCLIHGGRPPMTMGMFMGCGPRNSKSYPFESQFKRVVLHESTRSMHDKSWSQEVANSPLSREEGSLASRR